MSSNKWQPNVNITSCANILNYYDRIISLDVWLESVLCIKRWMNVNGIGFASFYCWYFIIISATLCIFVKYFIIESQNGFAIQFQYEKYILESWKTCYSFDKEFREFCWIHLKRCKCWWGHKFMTHIVTSSWTRFCLPSKFIDKIL